MDNNNFLAAVVLSIGILIGFHYFYEVPQAERAQRAALVQREAAKAAGAALSQSAVAAPTAQPARDRASVLAETSRVKIKTGELEGSINLKGGRIDDLDLVNYRENVAADARHITLLSPAGSAAPHAAYYAAFGWLAEGGIAVPDDQTIWKADRQTLEVGRPVLLTWDNGQGLVFERQIAVDEHFLFTVSDRVKNGGSGTVTLYPYGLISRHGHPKTADTYVLHEGPIGVMDSTLKEVKYKTLLEEEPKIVSETQGGWIGITDKYWLVTLLPPQDEKMTMSFSAAPSATAPDKPEESVFQTDYRGTAVSLAAGASTEHRTHLFAGAKRVRLLDEVEKKLGLTLFDRAIDFGWYYYLTKPFLYLLDGLNGLLGNMGLAILVFTILLKIITLPLSVKSYRSMAKMKTLQPQLVALQERFKNDRQQLSIATMELYQREKVNPMSGCMPIFIQIPIFFALYKVLYVGIEMRHAPLFGWIQDMSAPDPTSVLTLFGLIDFSLIPHLGIWPVLMGISMFAQQKMSPAPADKTQAQMFMLMPIIFTFMLGNVAAGLVFYWTISNMIGIGQQWYITRKVAGHK